MPGEEKDPPTHGKCNSEINHYVNNLFIHGKARVRVEASVWVSKGRVTTSMHSSKVFYYIKMRCPFVCVFVSVPTFFSTRRLTANKFGTHARIDPGIIRAQTNLTHPTPRGSQGGFMGSTIQKSRKCHELPRKSIKKINPHPVGGWKF